MKSNYTSDIPPKTIHFGKEAFQVTIKFENRRKLKIIVYPDLRVEAKAPLGKDISDVISKIKHRSRWIIKQHDYFRQFVPRLPERRYVSGETFYYLGRQYRLKIKEGSNSSVKLKGKFLWAYTPDCSNAEKIKQQVICWYKDHAKSYFEKRLHICYERAKIHRIILPHIKLRDMKKRWGSCTNNGSIILNTELIKAPVHCIDYVIIHELCHLRFLKHDDNFYRLLSLLVPDWKTRKECLEKVLI